MLRAGDFARNPKTGATLEVVAAPPGALDLRRRLKPGTGRALGHVHLDYLERFVVEEGEATAKIGGNTVTLGPGEELVVPRDAPHVNAYNAGTRDLVLRHVFEPPSDFALAYVETLMELMEAGRTDRQGELPVVATFAIGHATRTQTYAAGIPRPLQRRVLLPLGARLAPRLGAEIRLPAGAAAR